MFTARSADAPERGPSAEPFALAALGKQVLMLATAPIVVQMIMNEWMNG